MTKKAKIEIRCNDSFKQSVKKHAEAKGCDLTTYVKKAIFKMMEEDNK